MTPEQFAVGRKARLAQVKRELATGCSFAFDRAAAIENDIRQNDVRAIQAVARYGHAKQRRILSRCGISMKRIAWLGGR